MLSWDDISRVTVQCAPIYQCVCTPGAHIQVYFPTLYVYLGPFSGKWVLTKHMNMTVFYLYFIYHIYSIKCLSEFVNTAMSG